MKRHGWKLVGVALLFAAPAFGKARVGQGQACTARSACEPGLTCVPGSNGNSTCERACTANAECPTEQRCVKDGPARVCRHIQIGMPL